MMQAWRLLLEGTEWKGLGDIARCLARNATQIVTLFGSAYVAILSLDELKVPGRISSPAKVLGFAVVILTADLVLSISNTQKAGVPLVIFGTLLIASDYVGVWKTLEPSRYKAPIRTALVVVTLAAICPILMDTLNAWGLIKRSEAREVTNVILRIKSPVLADLLFEEHPDWTGADHAENNGQAYVSFVNEGLALIRANSIQSDRIGCLCFSNPFSYALLRKPPHGGSPFFDYGTNFTETSAPSPDQIIGDADIVMYAKKLHKNDVLLKRSDRVLLSRYVKAAESDNFWILFHKKQAGTAMNKLGTAISPPNDSVMK